MSQPTNDAPFSSPLTHFNAQGQVHMVDVGNKPSTRRVAVAGGRIFMQASTLELVRSGRSKKGDVLGVARLAAIMASKRTSDLIPLCHPLALSHVQVDLQCVGDGSTVHSPHVICTAEVHTHGQTGVEMEALMAVQVGLLTVYDMCKSVDRGMVIADVKLMEKSGGQSGHWRSGAS